jgi:mRNA interferase RelE/StbE
VPYRVQFETRARKEFLDLPKEAARLLTPAIDDLHENPRPPGAKKLTGLEGYRIRKGVYRALYAVDDVGRTITIYRVGHRRFVYR